MKKLVFLFFSSLFLCLSGLHAEPLCGQDELFYKYWSLKERFYEHFIRIDMDEEGNLLGDGIGDFNLNQYYWSYDKAGFSLPFSNIMHENGPRLTIGDGVIYLGYYIAVLATEYELLNRSNQTKEMDRVLTELYLALQAYRRLDMTANKHMEITYDECYGGQTCNFTPDLSGYSGFFCRDDGYYNFRDQFPHDPLVPLEWNYQFAAPGSDLIVTKPRNPHCDFLYDGVTDSLGNNVLSQDQLIGMLYGLAFVKKYIPNSAYVNSTNLIYMAESIASGMVTHITEGNLIRRIEYVGCEDDQIVRRGFDTRAYFFAIAKSAEYITSSSSLPTVFTGDKNWWKSSVIYNGAIASEDNARMYWQLNAVSNFAPGTGIIVSNTFQELHAFLGKRFDTMLAWLLLHDHSSSDLSKFDELQDTLETRLCLLDCSGPCYKGADNQHPDFDCNNQWSWCSHSALYNGHDALYCVKEFEDDEGETQNYRSKKGNGLDYMLLYNLYRLAYEPTLEPFYNPKRPEGNTNFSGASISGSDFICSDEEEEYSIENNLLGLFDFVEGWQVSSNLDLNSSATGNSILVEPSTTNDEAWVEVTLSSNGGNCRVTIRKNIVIGEPPFLITPYVTQTYECLPNYNIQLSIPPSIYPLVEDVSWSIVSGNGTIYPSPQDNQVDVTISGGAQNSANLTVKAIVSTPCFENEELIYLEFTSCNSGGCNPCMPIFPNPTTGVISIDFAEFDIDFKDKNCNYFTIMDAASGKAVFSKSIEQASEQIDLSYLKSGLYIIEAQVDCVSYSNTFVIDK